MVQIAEEQNTPSSSSGSMRQLEDILFSLRKDVAECKEMMVKKKYSSSERHTNQSNMSHGTGKKNMEEHKQSPHILV